MVKYFVSIKYKLSPQQVGFPTGKLVLFEKKKKMVKLLFYLLYHNDNKAKALFSKFWDQL